MRHIEMEGGNPLNVIIDVRAMDREHTKKKKFMIARVGRVGVTWVKTANHLTGWDKCGIEGNRKEGRARNAAFSIYKILKGSSHFLAFFLRPCYLAPSIPPISLDRFMMFKPFFLFFPLCKTGRVLEARKKKSTSPHFKRRDKKKKNRLILFFKTYRQKCGA